ncbi:MAG: hypothetical protein EB116_20145 [Betaproteobacteria bacterium]|nr:hypothetical protein [Betaproteobacteria bacterium]
MALGLPKLILASSSPNADTAGAYFDSQTLSVAAGGTTVVPAGMYIIQPVANIKVQTTANDTPTWVDTIAANTGGVLFSDGINVRLSNLSTAAITTMQVMTVNGGLSAPGTFNAT